MDGASSPFTIVERISSRFCRPGQQSLFWWSILGHLRQPYWENTLRRISCSCRKRMAGQRQVHPRSTLSKTTDFNKQRLSSKILPQMHERPRKTSTRGTRSLTHLSPFSSPMRRSQGATYSHSRSSLMEIFSLTCFMRAEVDKRI